MQHLRSIRHYIAQPWISGAPRKVSKGGQHGRSRVWFSSEKGTIPFGLFCVFDGHGGEAVSDYLEQNFLSVLTKSENFPSNPQKALSDAFLTIDRAVCDADLEGGSTGIVALIIQNYLHVAYVGDSVGVLCRSSRAQSLCTEIHKPSNPSEKKRIEAAGGKVSSGRVFGLLSVSRAFGDSGFKTSRGEFATQLQIWFRAFHASLAAASLLAMNFSSSLVTAFSM